MPINTSILIRSKCSPLECSLPHVPYYGPCLLLAMVFLSASPHHDSSSLPIAYKNTTKTQDARFCTIVKQNILPKS